MTETLSIEALGDGGDGIARRNQAPVFVAGALPGETVVVGPDPGGRSSHATLIDVATPSADRVAPPCVHFGRCGGCAAQHMSSTLYAAWKYASVVAALARRGFTAPPVEPLQAVPPASRRRVRLHALPTPQGLRLGFHAERSPEIVDIAACPAAVPAISAALPRFRAFLGAFLRNPADVSITVCDNGLDVVLDGRLALDQPMRSALADFAQVTGVARLANVGPRGRAEIIAEFAKPMVTIAGIAVDIPPDVFLQPSQAGEAALIAAVRDAVGAADPVVDLFAGVGTFALALAGPRAVSAFDADGDAIAAGLAAARRQSGWRFTGERRDLFRRPLAGDELKPFAAAIFDPPRQGAKAQAEALAVSSIPTVVAVSCDAGTFARDVRTLVDGGYRLEQVMPIDQFPWTAEIEVVAVLTKPKARPSRKGWGA